MTQSYDLLLSPHPDDIVYSAYSLLLNKQRPKITVTIFNVSRFTRLGLLPRMVVSPLRMIEDKLALGFSGSRVRFLNGADSVTRGPGVAPALHQIRRILTAPPAMIAAPLGVGGHPDHIAVRTEAISLRRWAGCELVLYEDLPYAVRSDDLASEERAIVSSIPGIRFREEIRSLVPSEIRMKLLLSGLYVSQAPKSELLLQHSRRVGGGAGSAYGERFFISS